MVLVMTQWAAAQSTDTRALSPFSQVKVASGIDVYLSKGTSESARVVVTGADPSRVLTEVSGRTLRIELSGGSFRNVNAKVYVTYVSIDRLHASSAASIFSEGIVQATEFSIGASSAGSIEVNLKAQSVRAEASSAGEVRIEGETDRLAASASSAGSIDTYRLAASKVRVEVSSGASAKVAVSHELDAQASSGGDVRYRGNPARTNTRASSGGSVKKSN